MKKYFQKEFEMGMETKSFAIVKQL